MKKLLFLILTICFTTFFIEAKAQSLVPVYRYFKAATGKHFYTTNHNELGDGGAGWVEEPNLGNVWNAPGGGAIYRFYNSTTTAHYYSLSSTPPPGFHFESILGYNVFIPGFPTTVYQYHDSHGDFFYTTDTTTPTGYVLDGPAFSVDTGNH